MRLFEWLGEWHKPGPVGRIRFRRNQNEDGAPPRLWIILATIVGQGLFWMLTYLIFQQSSWQIIIGVLLGLFIYIILSFFIEPAPRYDNLGWFGGLVNHPFRVSDNINRFLLIFDVILTPGKLISYSFIIIYQLLWYKIFQKK